MKPPASGSQALQRIVPFVFASVLLLYFGFVYWTADKIPTRVATHFGSNGQANGWMSHSNYLLFLSLTPFVLMLLFKGIAWMTRHLPARYINIPRREYWLAPERRATTVDYICAWLTVLQCLLLLFFAMSDYFIILANRVDPPRISTNTVLLQAVGFLIALLAWTTAFLLRMNNLGESNLSQPCHKPTHS